MTDQHTTGAPYREFTTSPDAMRWIPAEDVPAHEERAAADDLTALFGEPIHVYTRAQALEDGALVAVDTATAREAGIVVPLALTAAAHGDCVAWTESDNDRKGTCQDEAGRLWDVLYMTRQAIRRAGPDSRRVVVDLYRVPREGRGRAARRTRLCAEAGPGDDGELVITVMLPDED